MVKHLQYYLKSTVVYPGNYQPVFSKTQDMAKIKSIRPPVNIIEYPDYYQVEMPAPGFEKSDFFVKTQGYTLWIEGYKKCADLPMDGHYHNQGFKCRYVARSIDMPGDADTEYGTAEYKNGVLYVYIYKASCPVHNNQNFIIVY